jgi:hypothetical protein
MTEILEIDRALYEVDDATHTYRYYAEIQIGKSYVQKKTSETKDILMDIPEYLETETKKFLGIKIRIMESQRWKKKKE